MVYFPSKLVTEPMVVPLAMIVTPGRASPVASSVTVPVTLMV